MASAQASRMSVTELERRAAEAGVDISTDVAAIHRTVTAMEAKVRAASSAQARVGTAAPRSRGQNS